MNGLEKVLSCSPIFKSEEAELVEYVVANHHPVLIPFTRKIMWIRESESTVSFWHAGKEIKSSSTFNDFYGYLTSIDSAIKDAKKLAKVYSVNEDSTLEIRVELTVYEKPVVEDASNEACEWNKEANRKTYLQVLPNSFWFRNNQDVLKKIGPNLFSDNFDVRSEAHVELNKLRIESKELINRKVVWTSFHPDETFVAQIKGQLLALVDSKN